MSLRPESDSPVVKSRPGDLALRFISIFGAGIACAAIIGFWRGVSVQCGIHPSYVQYGICPLDSGPVVTYLTLLTLAVLALAVGAVTGKFPRVASIAGATLVVGAFLFPYVFAFADLGVGGLYPGFVLGGMLALGGATGFLESLREDERRRALIESYNWLSMGGALIAFTGALAYWLPQNLSAPTVCYGPAGGLACLPSASPLLPEAFSLGLIALGIGVASPILVPQWPEIGATCTAVSTFAAFIALLDPTLPLVALSLGFGSILAFVGVVPRMLRSYGAERSPTGWPSHPA